MASHPSVTRSTGSLRQRVLKAGGWTVAGSLSSQLLRFGSNLVLTRLLFPEAFGLMAILNAVLIGLNMLSDVGLSLGIIRSKRGDGAEFLNTVWTIQVIKGALVAAAMWIAAASIARAYGEAELAQMMPMMGLVALIGGFVSTNIDLAKRNVDAARLTMMEIGSQAVGIAAMILFAWMDPTPWALVWGNVVGTSVRVLASHLVLPGGRNRFAWDRSAAHEVFSFGGWVLLSSAISYLSGEGRQLLLAALVDMRLLGLLGLATTLTLAAWSTIQQVAGKVLFPAYSEVVRTDPSRLSGVVERTRRAQLLPACLVSTLFAFGGPLIIRLLYDPRYADAGLILQIQGPGVMGGLLSASYSGVLWAIGRPGVGTALLATQVAINVLSMVIGSQLAGPLGVVVGSAMSGWVFYPVNAWVFRRFGLWHPRTDAAVFVVAAAVATFVVMTADWSVAAHW